MKLESVKLDVADFVATVTLNRPSVNALGRAIREELLWTFDALHDRADVRAIVLTGQGRVFSAGADLKERSLMTGEAGEYGQLNRLVREVFYSLMDAEREGAIEPGIVDDAGNVGRESGIVLAQDGERRACRSKLTEHWLDRNAGWAVALDDGDEAVRNAGYGHADGTSASPQCPWGGPAGTDARGRRATIRPLHTAF